MTTMLQPESLVIIGNNHRVRTIQYFFPVQYVMLIIISIYLISNVYYLISTTAGASEQFLE